MTSLVAPRTGREGDDGADDGDAFVSGARGGNGAASGTLAAGAGSAREHALAPIAARSARRVSSARTALLGSRRGAPGGLRDERDERGVARHLRAKRGANRIDPGGSKPL